MRQHHELRRVTIDLWCPRPWIVATRVQGHFEHAAARKLVELREEVLGDAPVISEFHDWMEMTGYDSASRHDLTRHSFEHRTSIASIHILTVSKIIQMGITVASIALGDMLKSYARREEFEALFASAREAHPPRPGRSRDAARWL